MASVLEVSANNATTGPVFGVNTAWYPFGDADAKAGDTTEANQAVIRRSPGTFSGLYVRTIANTVTGSSTGTFRKNSGAGSQTVTITASFNGAVQDTSHTDSVVAGDTADFQLAMTGSNQLTMALVAIVFTATTNTVKRFQNSGTRALTTTTVDWRTISGGSGTIGAGESNVQFRVRLTGTFQNLCVNAATNTRTTDGTITSRKNTAPGAMSITVTAGFAGVIEDTSNTDSVISGDLYAYSQTTATGGSGTLTIQDLASELQTTDGTFHFSIGSTGPGTQAANTTRYYPIGGVALNSATESDVQCLAQIEGSASKIWVKTTTNTVTATSTFTLQNNGSPGSESVAITSSFVGMSEDTVHSDTIDATDLINYKLVAGATGTSIAVAAAGILMTPLAPNMRWLGSYPDLLFDRIGVVPYGEI